MPEQGIPIDEMLAMIRKDEGLVLKKYKCPKGFWTIGFGFNLEANKLPDFINWYFVKHDVITDEMAEYLLDVKVSDSIRDCKAALPSGVWDSLTPRRRMVLVMMTYNMGAGFLKGPRMWPDLHKALLTPGYEDDIREMTDSLWYDEVGGRAKRLIEIYRQG